MAQNRTSVKRSNSVQYKASIESLLNVRKTKQLILNENDFIEGLLSDLKNRSIKKRLFNHTVNGFVINYRIISDATIDRKSHKDFMNEFIYILNSLHGINTFLGDIYLLTTLNCESTNDYDMILAFKFALNDVMCDWYDSLEQYTDLYDNATLLNFYLKIKENFIYIIHLNKVFNQWHQTYNKESSSVGIIDILYNYISYNNVFISKKSDDLKYIKYCFLELLKGYVNHIFIFINFGTYNYNPKVSSEFEEMKTIPQYLSELIDKINLTAKINFFRNKLNLKKNINGWNNIKKIENSLNNVFTSKMHFNNNISKSKLNSTFSSVIYDSNILNNNLNGADFTLGRRIQHQFIDTIKPYCTNKIDNKECDFDMVDNKMWITDTILKVYNDASEQFMDYTWNEFKLQQFFQFVKNVILCNDYELVYEFINEYVTISGGCDSSAGKDINHNFAYLFHLKFADVFPFLMIKLSQNLHKRISHMDLDSTETQREKMNKYLPFSDLDLKIYLPSPFDEIFTHRHVEIYQGVLQQNLQLRYSQDRLCKMYWLDNIKHFKNKYIIKRIWIHRNIMLKFLNAFTQFWSIQSVNVYFKNFLHQITTSTNFNQVVEFHNQFCASLNYLYLIAEELSLPRKMLTKIYTCVDEFIQLFGDTKSKMDDSQLECTLTTDDNNQQHLKLLDQIETNFFKSTYLVTHYLSNLSSLGHFDTCSLYKEFVDANLCVFNNLNHS